MSIGGRIEGLGAALGRPAPTELLELLVSYTELVQKWNARMNLTAAREPEQLVEVLHADAFVLADRLLIPEGVKIVDVGSGAGAPAIPTMLLRADLRAVLVEPLRKRVAFLRTVIGSLGLAERVVVVEGKVDPLAPTAPGGPFGLAMSRATLHPPDWLEVGVALAPRVLVLTAAEPPPAPTDGHRVAHAVSYVLPSSGAGRTISAYDRAS